MATHDNTPSTDDRLRDRAMGALMGAFIGDALGVGPHWYYDRTYETSGKRDITQHFGNKG